MSITRLIALSSVALLALGCAQQPQQSARDAVRNLQEGEVQAIRSEAQVVTLEPAPSTSEQVVCSYERVTGTHRRREVCQTRGQRQHQRESAQEWLRSGGRSGGVSVVPAVR